MIRAQRRPHRPARAALGLAALVSLFAPPSATAQVSSPSRDELQTAVFAGGCFWGMEAVFEHVKGVTEVVTGYTGGTLTHPTYEAVSAGIGNHAEAVRVTFDPAQVAYAQLVEVFMRTHDPTSLNRQGPDEGPQYRSAIFWTNGYQEHVARRVLDRLRDTEQFRKPIVTEIVQLDEFWMAEPDHQNYVQRHPDAPYVVVNDLPKLEIVRRRFAQLWRP